MKEVKASGPEAGVVSSQGDPSVSKPRCAYTPAASASGTPVWLRPLITTASTRATASQGKQSLSRQHCPGGRGLHDGRGGARLEQAFFLRRTLQFIDYFGAWIPIPGQLLTCCVTLPKSPNLSRTSSVKWVSNNLRLGDRSKRECLESFPSMIPGRKISRSRGFNYLLLTPR